jgi:hypothetical protein
MHLTERQQQFILTACDPAASPNEQVTEAAFFFRSLRQQFHDGYAFLSELKSNQRSAEQSKYSEVTMRFGKYRRRKLDEIDPTYLLWVLANVAKLSRCLRWAIERYLEAIQFANYLTN